MKQILSSVAALALTAMLAGAPAARADTPPNQLVVALSLSNILTLDPAGITGRDTVQVLNNVYDTLTALNPENASEFMPRLAESWEIAPDGRTITYHLREGVTFASGNPLTAEDVVWSLRRLLTLNLAQASFLKTRGFKAEAGETLFTAPDARTVVVTLPQPDDPRYIMMVLSQSGPGSVMDRKEVLAHEANGDLGAGWLKTHSAGSGAFVLTEWKSNEYVILSRNDKYWGEAPALRRVLMRHLPESQSQRLMLEKGDIDIGYSLLAADLAALEGDENVEVRTTPGAGFYYLASSLKDERFANPKVREALRYLIDYDGLNKAVMPYYGVPHQRPLSTGVTGLLPDPGYRLDPARAKALLAEAGYPNGFHVTLRALAEPPFLNAATAIQGTLAQGGIDAEIITGSGDQIYGAMRERKFELIVGRGGGGQQPHPDSNLRAMAYNPDNSDAAKLTNYQAWRTSFHDEKLNQMIVAALLEKDPAAQAAKYGEVQDYMEAVVAPIQPFSEVVDTAAYRADVKGLTISPWLGRFETVSKAR